jgi:hypothetical protein
MAHAPALERTVNSPKPLPTITRERKNGHPSNSTADSITLAVYAPFGTDNGLSTYPDGASLDLIQHPLVQNLATVAGYGIHVVALIDRFGRDTHLVDIRAGRADAIHISTRWKLDMASPSTLSGFLKHAHQSHLASEIVLALEGHGAGFLPDLDRSKFTTDAITGGGKYEWRISAGGSTPLPIGSSVLPMGSPVLPIGSPVLPTNHAPMSTCGLGAALKDAMDAGVPKPAVIHFNNCFNMSVELLHTVMPYAEYATGYPSYNFFTAGAAYPMVFDKLAQRGSASSGEVAKWLADANHAVLAVKGNHPTAGGVIRLAKMQEVVERIDDLADALLAVLRNAANFKSVAESKIKPAIMKAQRYDATRDFDFETPDELTDIRSFAQALLDQDFDPPFDVHTPARALLTATEGIKVYGDPPGHPWMEPAATWDFSGDLALNIFLPDPLRKGWWDWRSPFYLDVNPDPNRPRLQPNVIDFVKATDWVDFIIEYHRDLEFKGLLPASIPEFPVFNPKSEPRPWGKPANDHEGDDCSDLVEGRSAYS